MEGEGAGEAAEAGDGAASGPIYLYKVIDREAVPREKVKALWRAGHVSGLFNLPTEELFNACRDFGVKVKVDIKGLVKAKEDGALLQAKLKTLIERSVDKERELFELKAKVADLSQANLVQEEQFKRRLNELTTRNKALAKARKRTNKEKTEAKDENLRLKAELERVRQQLEEARERERQNRERGQERERERERERKGKAKREQEDAEEAEADADRQRRKQMAAATASDEDGERAKQLQVELKRERELLKQMAVENQKLTSRIQQLMIENEEMKLSSSITQTDHLNRKLLMSFMSTMDSLRRLEDDDDDNDGGGRDGEAEWEAHHGEGFDGYLDDDDGAVDGNGTGTREWITTTLADEERPEAEERDKETGGEGEEEEEQKLHKAPWGE